MSGQSIRGSQNVQIQDVQRSLIQITYEGAARTVPLEPAHVPVAARLPSPARLVRAHAGVVPYVDRGGLLAELRGWVDTETHFSGQVIGGRGGSGKTRLAVELCRLLRERDWLCGFLSRIADPAMLDALVQAPTARLVVVDYAESRVEQLELLLPLLKASASDQAPVRVLLLVRTGAAEIESWQRQLRNRIDALDAILDECETRALEETPLDAGERQSLFAAAAAAFAARLESAVEPPPTPELGEEVFGNSLMIVVAAFLAVHGEEAAPPKTRTELLDEVLGHERRYWRSNVGSLAADPVLLERAVALATLVNAESEARAAELLRMLPELADAPAERRSQLARWLAVQYPGPRWWNPLEPDLVGEHLVAECFTRHADALRSVLAMEDPDALTRPLEVLARAAADHPDLRAVLEAVLGEAMGKLCAVAVSQAEAVRDTDLLYGNAVTTASALTAAVGVVALGEVALSAALSALPLRTNVILSELGATLTGLYVQWCRDHDKTEELAIGLNNLSNRLGDAGRFEEALAAIEESVEIRRGLAQSNPLHHAPRLAGGLSNLSNWLAEAGRNEEALAASRESVEAFRILHGADADGHVADLAMSLNNLSNRLADAGLRDDALAASRESVELRRPLAVANPEAHWPYLASALNNLSGRLSDVGLREEALGAIEESADIYRRLATANPAAYSPYLASALSNLSGRLSAAGHREEALVPIEESTTIYRNLASANPAAYGHSLAISLNNLSNRLGEVGRPEEALAAIEAATELYSDLAEANPAAYGPSLAMSLNNLSNRLSVAGRDEEALERSRQSTDLHRRLAAANAIAHGADLAMALNNHAGRLSDNGLKEEAARIGEEACEIYRGLAADNRLAYGPPLAGALNNLSGYLADLGHEGGLEAAEEAAEIFRGLAEGEPAYEVDLAMARNTLSGRLAEAGRSEEALAVVQESTEIYRRLFVATPAAFSRNLAISLNNLSRRLRDCGREEEAAAVERELQGLIDDAGSRGSG